MCVQQHSGDWHLHYLRSHRFTARAPHCHCHAHSYPSWPSHPSNPVEMWVLCLPLKLVQSTLGGSRIYPSGSMMQHTHRLEAWGFIVETRLQETDCSRSNKTCQLDISPRNAQQRQAFQQSHEFVAEWTRDRAAHLVRRVRIGPFWQFWPLWSARLLLIWCLQRSRAWRQLKLQLEPYYQINSTTQATKIHCHWIGITSWFMQLLGRVPKYEHRQGNLYGAARDAWGVLAVSSYVRADWEDDMEPGPALVISRQTRAVCTCVSLDLLFSFNFLSHCLQL